MAVEVVERLLRTWMQRLTAHQHPGARRVHRHVQRLATIGSANTAKAFGLYPRKGTLLPGSDADFVIVDPDEEWVVRPADLASASDFSSYEGLKLRGRARLTAVRGTVVYQEGKMIASPGHGRYYRRYPEVQQATSATS